jgi:LPS export ABC transporter protein LptC
MEAALLRLGARATALRRIAASARSTGLACVVLLLAPLASAAPSTAPPLRLERLTFVATREAAAEIRVQADVALIDESTSKASLEKVDAEWEDDAGRPSLRIRCERGELDLETNDLLASGDVHGQLADGRRFIGPWLRYDRTRGVAFTRAPVEILEGQGRVLRGGGLEYHVRERRLRLTSGARVEEPGTP